MRFLTTFRAICAAFLLVGSSANAAVIFDTGPAIRTGPGDPGFGIYDQTFFPNGHEFSYLAGRFSLDSATDITELSVFVRNFTCCGAITMAYRIGLMQGPINPFDDAFVDVQSLISTILLASGEAGWASVAPVNLHLGPGDWWIVYSPAPFDLVPPGAFAFTPALPGDVPNPMVEYATFNQTFAGWRHLDPATNWASFAIPIPATFGFRVSGEVAAVPEPAGLLLMAGPLLAWIAARRFAKRC